MWLAALVLAASGFAWSSVAQNVSYNNPMLPGWHSDPSCIFVPEKNNTFFCVTSTFLVTPGLPVHASHDLQNWRIASHVINTRSQLPDYSTTYGSSNGVYAATLRYRDGTFYVITAYFGNGIQTLLFNSTDPFLDAAWSNPLKISTIGYDPDLFWDDDGQAYLTTAGTTIAPINVKTGEIGSTTHLWNGTGGLYPEGPHMYKKDGYYYLMISEGGTELGHAVTIARSTDILGPFEGYSGNPILTNRNTTNLYQTVGHADIFQDAAGNFWACALTTRSGPEWVVYPMGRETALTPVTWDKGQWPVFQQVHDVEQGPLPPQSRSVAGTGPFVGDPDIVNFEPGSKLPNNFVFWRWPKPESFSVSPSSHPNTLRLIPTGPITSQDSTAAGADGITLVMRLQTDFRFVFSADVSFQPQSIGEEAGLTVFLTQAQHIDLGVVLLPSNHSKTWAANGLSLRLRSTGGGNYQGPPIEVVKHIPEAWRHAALSLQIEAVNRTHYAFSAAPSFARSERVIIGYAPSTIVSGGSGRFTGSLVGAYATNNNGTGRTPSYISQWRYFSKAK